MADYADLDRTDFEILRLLLNDARSSNKEIASSVGLAPSSCHERIKSLRERGILLGAHAEVNVPALGFGLEALLFLELSKHERRVVEHFLNGYDEKR